jgi:hypothetical protein
VLPEGALYSVPQQKRVKLDLSVLPKGVKDCAVGKLRFGPSQRSLREGVVAGEASRLWEVVVPHVGTHRWTIGYLAGGPVPAGTELVDPKSARAADVAARSPVDVMFFGEAGPSLSDKLWSSPAGP